MVTKLKEKIQFQKLMKLAPILTCYYKLRYIHNPWHIQNLGIFKSSTVFRYPSDILLSFQKIFPNCHYFCMTLLPRPFQMFDRILNTYLQICIYKCYLACTVFLSSVSSTFRHVRALFTSILTHIQSPGIFLSQSTFRLQGIFVIPC